MRREGQQTDSEWGGSRPAAKEQEWNRPGGTVPRTEKYDLEPSDDDDYAPRRSARASEQAGGRSGQVNPLKNAASGALIAL